MDYPASTISLIKGKWYVTVTVPEPLRQQFKVKQVRRSTGTSDKRRAQSLKHAKTTEIYRKFDAAQRKIERGTYKHAMDLSQKLFDIFLQSQGETPRSVKPYLAKHAEQTIGIIDRVAYELMAGGSMLTELNSSHKNAAALAREYADERVQLITDRFRNPEDRLASLMAGLAVEDTDAEHDEETRLTMVLPRYINERPWGREKTKVEFQSKLERFINVVGDLRLSEVKKLHVYELAESLAAEGKANKTIRTYVTALRGLLDWCEQKGFIEHDLPPEAPSFITRVCGSGFHSLRR